MIDRTDPERRAFYDERVATATSQFSRGAISEDVYRASLHGAGLRGRQVDDHVGLYRPARPLSEVSASVLDKFVSGLP